MCFLVIAINQHITYHEHLPILLGEDANDLLKRKMNEDDAEVDEIHTMDDWKVEFESLTIFSDHF